MAQRAASQYDLVSRCLFQGRKHGRGVGNPLCVWGRAERGRRHVTTCVHDITNDKKKTDQSKTDYQVLNNPIIGSNKSMRLKKKRRTGLNRPVGSNRPARPLILGVWFKRASSKEAHTCGATISLSNAARDPVAGCFRNITGQVGSGRVRCRQSNVIAGRVGSPGPDPTREK